MTVVNSALIATVSTETLDTPQVNTVNLTVANTEYSFPLPVGTKTYALQNRNDGLIKYRTTSGGAHWTLFPGQPYYINNLRAAASVTLYLESSKPAQTIEILSWT